MRLLLTVTALLFTSTLLADLVVVVDKQSTLEQLNQREVANIFLSKKTSMKNIGRVYPVELNNSSYKEDFYQKISGKTLPQVNSYWTTLIFTGKGKPPRNMSDFNQLVEELKNNPDSITYLPADKITENMKVVYVFSRAQD